MMVTNVILPNDRDILASLPPRQARARSVKHSISAIALSEGGVSLLRFSLIAAAILSVTIMAIMRQPPAPVPMAYASADAAEVSRAETDLTSFSGIATKQPAAPETATAAVESTASEDKLTDALKLVSLTDPKPAPSEKPGLEGLIITAPKQGQPGTYVDLPADGAAGTARSLTRPITPQKEKTFFDSPRTYTVQPGDSLASISYRFYGRTDRHIDIMNANRGVLSPSGQIEVGLRLTIPEF